ncbi:MAG: 30S ribosome-binding factor RbfA [Steroidobacteraceae bacterium]
MSDSRRLRIEAELKRALAELATRGVKDPRVGNVTITGVSLTADMRTARVYFVPFGATRDTAEVEQGLARAAGFLRGEAGRRLGLRYAPRLVFVVDESFDRAERLTSLLHEAARGREP